MKNKNLPEIGVASERVKMLEASLTKFSVSMDSTAILDSLSPIAAARELKRLRRLVATAKKKES
jgi:hypothetical protein